MHRDAHGLAGVDESKLLGVRVALVEIVAGVGGAEGTPGFCRKADDGLVYALLDFKSLVLNLRNKLPLPKSRAGDMHFRGPDRIFNPPRFVDGPRRQRTGDQSLRVGEQVEIRSAACNKNHRGSRGDQLDRL